MDYYEADDYFYYGNGEYKFNPDSLPKAHSYCRAIVEKAMKHGDFAVIVSNTFTTEKEMKPYLDMAKEYGYDVTSIIVENRHGNKSVHDVPVETIDKMRDRFSIKL